jgi:hypothetical protein
MVIISDAYGQLGNRLILFSHFIANAREFGYPLCYPGFQKYAEYFTGTRNNFFCTYPPESRGDGSWNFLRSPASTIITLLAGVCCRMKIRTDFLGTMDITSRNDRERDFDLSQQGFLFLAQKRRMVLTRGWLFRDEENLRKHADPVRRYFTPVAEHAANISRVIERAREGCDLLVGVHIRQGDYRNWLGGKHYHPTGEYLNIMKRADGLWSGKRVRYLLCSDEKQDKRLFQGMNCAWGSGNQLEDLYAFASCDYLMGPPSTYTLWASFYGSVPLCVIHELNKPLTLEGFTLC